MKTCKRGHQRADDVRSCTECKKITSKAWYHDNIKEKQAYMRAHSKARYKKLKTQYKEEKRQRVYGITPEQYDQMLLEHQNKCAICGKTQELNKSLCIDHDHETGNVRGLLCQVCNKAIGLLGDSIQNLEQAILYLKKYKTKETK